MRIASAIRNLINSHRDMRLFARLFFEGLAGVATSAALHSQQALQLTIQWDKPTVVAKSTPTMQVVVNPGLRPSEPLSAPSYKAVNGLGADYVRYVPWLPNPRLAVAELESPTSRKTSWSFSLIDPMTKDFLNATAGHPTVMNFSTIPAWLSKTDRPVTRWWKQPQGGLPWAMWRHKRLLRLPATNCCWPTNGIMRLT
jgi:hypothetical protein